MIRDYLILHSFGALPARGRSAAEALRKAFLPLGFRDAFAVVETDCASTGRDQDNPALPFCTFIGQPAGKGGK